MPSKRERSTLLTASKAPEHAKQGENQNDILRLPFFEFRFSISECYLRGRKGAYVTPSPSPAVASPLQGIRVADFTWVWAGPTCTMQLAYMGAEVIRMESMRRVCTLRMLPPWPDGQPGINRSGYFNQYNQGKRSLALNLKEPRAMQVARDLIGASDIVVENF